MSDGDDGCHCCLLSFLFFILFCLFYFSFFLPFHSSISLSLSLCPIDSSLDFIICFLFFYSIGASYIDCQIFNSFDGSQIEKKGKTKERRNGDKISTQNKQFKEFSASTFFCFPLSFIHSFQAN